MASAKTSRFCLYKCTSCCPLPWLVEGSLKAPKWLLLTIYNSCCWCNIGNHSNFLFLANWSYAFLTAQVRKANRVVLPSCLWRPHIRHVSANVVKHAEPMIVIGHLKQQTPTENNLLIKNFKSCDANKQHSPTSERQSTRNVAIPPTFSFLQLVDPNKIHWLQNRVEPFPCKNLYMISC